MKKIKKFILLCVALLSPLQFSLLTLNAQTIEGGEAFYIWQNDGHFDGFFYDDVQEIRYSRIDTLGIERAEYITQEIVTADSTYRIMLSAIDSVSFVQPEIKFAKGVRFMETEGMMTYFSSITTTGDKMSLTFKGTMPTALRPQVGNVLSCPELEGFDGAFVGKVSRVSNSGSNLVVECGFIDELGDVFEQFITVEQVKQVQTPQGTSMRRRIAGLDVPQKIEGNINDYTLFNFSTTLEGNISLMEKLKLGLALNVGFGMTVSAVYNISWSKFYIKTEMKEQVAAGASITLDGELYNNADLTALPGVGALVSRFSKIPFPANFPILYANMTPMPFARAEAHVKATVNAGVQVKSLTQSVELKDEWPFINVRMGYLPAPILPLTFEPDASFTFNAEISGMFQTGMKFPIKTGTEEWLKKLVKLEAGTTVFAGPKFSGAIDFNILKAKKGVYESMKDSKVDLSLMSIDTEFAAEGSFWGKKTEKKITKSVTFGDYVLTLFPSIDGTKFDITGDKMNTVTATYETSGDVFLPEKLGFGLYAKDDGGEYADLKLSKYRNETYFLNTFNSVSLAMEDVPSGIYMARPIISTPFGVVPVYKDEQLITIAPQELVLMPNIINAEEGGGEFTVQVINSINMPITCSTEQNWIHPQIKTDVGGAKAIELYIKVDENNEDAFREGIVTVRLRLSTTETVEKTVTVKQYGGLQLSTSSLNFTMEGSTQYVEILTSQSPITINLNGADSWLDYELNDRTLYITARENEGAPRDAAVTVSTWSAKHNGINARTIKVHQDGPIDVTIDPMELLFQANGGSQRAAITTGSFTFDNASVPKNAQDWIIVEKQADGIIVTTMPNTTGVDRESRVDCNFSKKMPDGKPFSTTISVKVSQSAGTAAVTPEQLNFAADGGKQNVTINTGTFPHYGAAVRAEGLGWVHAQKGSGGIVTITVDPNLEPNERECYVDCWVSGSAEPAEAEMLKLPVRIVQAAGATKPINPDPENSPFKYITFYAEAYANIISTAGDNIEEPQKTGAAFNFKADNSNFTVKENGNITHVECWGHDTPVQSGPRGRYATLTFDIDNATQQIKNLVFNGTWDNLHSMYLPAPEGGIWVDGLIEASFSMSFGDLKCSAFTPTYKEAKDTLANGLKFNSFSAYANSTGSYSDPSLPTVHQRTNYEYVDDPRNNVWLMISQKETEAALEWPSAEVMNSLKDGGMPVYEGTKPPTVEGNYYLTPITIVNDKMNATEEMGDIDGMVLKFSGQDGNHLSFDCYYTAGDKADYANGTEKALIQGNGSEFSICVPDSEATFIISGKVSGNSVTDLHVAYTHPTKANKYFIFKDKDGSSSKTTWAPTPDDD